MEQQSYYRNVTIDGCNEQTDEIPLQVNCVGYALLKKPFQQRNLSGREDFYLQYATEGKLHVHTFGGTQIMEPGMFTVYRPHTPYSYELLPGEEFGYYWVHFTGFHAGRLLANLGITSDRIHQTDDSERRASRIVDAFLRQFEEFANRRPGFDDLCAAGLTEILVELARGVDRVAVGPMRKLASVSYLHSHFREDVRVSELAEMEHLSESRYREVFRRHTGFSPLDYRTALRMQHACDLLTLTDDSITEVAAETGYTDVLYFLRVFKMKKGMTPLEYRSRYRADAETVLEKEKN